MSIEKNNHMETVNLHATIRQQVGNKINRLRMSGQLPAVIYGHGQESRSISIDAKEFKKAFRTAGSSTLVDLVIDDEKPVKTLIQQPQFHYLTSLPIHADFYAVKMDEEIETTVPINFIGVSPAVEELEGNFIANKNELTVRCLPANLIPEVEIDISVLKTFDDQIRVSDLKLPSTIEVMHDPEESIALVAAPITAEELEAELATDQTDAEKAAVEALAEETEAAGGEEAGTDSTEEPKQN